jgi:hypothetical protein
MDNDKLIQKIDAEIWKAIPGWEGLYEVSSIGRVRSVGRYVAYRHGLRWCEGRIRAIKTYQGYNYVNLVFSDNGRQIEKRCLVHRLVAEAFLPNPEKKRCVDHLNTIRTDNRVENLRWVTHLENQKNPITAKRLAEPARRVIRLAPDGSTKEYAMIKDVIADGFSMQQVCNCCRKYQRFHRGYVWVYKGEELKDYAYYVEQKRLSFVEAQKKKIKPLIAYNENEEIEFNGQIEAVNAGFDARAICDCIKNGRKHHGYYWRFK